MIAKGVYLFGTSGSQIPDMETVLAKLERGELDTNISVDAITGMEGVTDALAAVEARTSGGKIVVYPALHDLGMVRLSELAARLPAVARELRDGRWTRAAEDALLSTRRTTAGLTARRRRAGAATALALSVGLCRVDIGPARRPARGDLPDIGGAQPQPAGVPPARAAARASISPLSR